jgi:hypothetical protein
MDVYGEGNGGRQWLSCGLQVLLLEAVLTIGIER